MTDKKTKNIGKNNMLDFDTIKNNFDIRTNRAPQSSSGSYHKHKGFSELQYIHAGSGYYFIKDRLYRLKAKSLFIIHDTDTHAYVMENSKCIIHKTSLMFANSILKDIPDKQLKEIHSILKCGKTSFHQVDFDEKNATEIELFFSVIKKESAGEGVFKKDVIINTLSSLLLKTKESHDKNQEKHEAGRTLSIALDFINRNYHLPLSLKNIAENTRRSPWHISHIFKDDLKMTFKDYLNTRRIIAAKEIIESRDERKMFAVATETGYRSLSAFNRNFKAITGMSPSQYRGICNSDTN